MSFDYAAKIQGLLAHAEDEANPEEVRARFRAKAEDLMRQYRIAEEELIASDATAVAVIRSDFVVASVNNEFQYSYQNMARYLAGHTGCRFASRYEREYAGQQMVTVGTFVGYEGDVRYAEFLWTAVHLMFATRIDARKNDSLSDQENAYFLRSSGKSRAQVATILWGSGPKDGPAHGKVQRLYLAECAKRGEEPLVSGRNVNAKEYRRSYSENFTNTLYRRLRQARDAADSVGGGLVLHGREERVNEAFYNLFPRYRPDPNAAATAAAAETQEECEACKKSKSKSGKCKYHKPYQVTKADQERWYRQSHSPAALAGKAAGSTAASQVSVTRGHKNANRLDASGRAIEN